jgi:hypothetical protein
MTPSIDVRITSLVRTLGDLVIPAIDPDNDLAREQAGLMLGHLSMLAEQLPHVAGYEALCLDDLRNVARGLAETASGGGETQTAARAVLDACNAEGAGAHAAYNQIGFALEDLIQAAAADGDAALRKAIGPAIVRHGLRQTRRERSWFAMTGIDTLRADLPAIPEMVAGA